ncbi:relaxase MobL [Breznakia pachnodae]|uniref:Relaxase n=1 Tax=Breznakia pachnodae TaxID=265178 RepID=A0ABU0E3T8_9FIRM|nr:relaxase MobL [Breznakia pachnodae]MDQ0361552.1 hypothetical protein [Breznakia pachnodae]
MEKTTPGIIFDLRYRATEYFRGKPPPKLLKTNTKGMHKYFNRSDACDKTFYSLDAGIETENTKDAFDYYNYRIGSTGAFNHTGYLTQEKVLSELEKYKPEIVYNCVISFTDEFASDNNLKPKKNMQDLIKKTMNKNIKALGFDPENVSWSAYYHTNTNQPHVHVSFYEKKRTKKRYMIEKSKLTKANSAITRLMKLNTDLYIKRDDLKHGLFKKLDELGFSDNIKRLIVKSENNSKKAYKVDKEYTQKLEHLEKVLPQQGSFKFNSANIKPHREEIMELVDYIKKHGGISEVYKEFIEHLDKEVEAQIIIYGGDKDSEDKINFKQKRIDQIDTRLANLILSNIKAYRLDCEDYEEEFDDKRVIRGLRKNNIKTRATNFLHATVLDLSSSIEHTYYAGKSMQRQADEVARKAQEEIRSKVIGR